MTTVLTLLNTLHKLGIKLSLDEKEDLVIRGDKAALTPALIGELRASKADIVETLKNSQNKKPVIAALDRQQSHFALSFAQQRLWLLDKIDGGSAHYNIPCALNLSVELDFTGLESAFSTIISRHESLRTRFVEGRCESSSGNNAEFQRAATQTSAAHNLAEQDNHQPFQMIQVAEPFKVTKTDLSSLSDSAKTTALANCLTQEANSVFDLTADLMLRAQLVCLSESEHVLLVTMHHIASDGWSMAVLINEFSALYRAYCQKSAAVLPELTVQYADYAHWQRHWLQGKVLDQQLNYWEKQLADLPMVHSLPLDYARPPVQSFFGETLSTQVGAEDCARLNQLCQRHSATLFMGLHAVFSVLLARYSNETDIVVGSPIANREQAEVANLIGFFVNTLVLRSDLGEQPSFSALLAKSKQMLLDAYAHQQVPFEQIVERLKPERNLAHSPLFQVMLVLQNNEEGVLSLPNLTLKTVAQDACTAMYDLTLTIENSESGLALKWEYNRDLFRAKTIKRMSKHFNNLLSALVSAPEVNVFQATMLDKAEIQQQLMTWNESSHTKLEVFEQKQCIHHLFEAQVEQFPDAVAVVYEGQQLTYQALNHKTNQLAQYLITQRHVTSGSFVGLCVERSLDMIVGILAILKAGAAYVPLDPEYPKARLEHMLTDANLSTVLIHQHLYEKTPVNTAQAVCLDDAGLLATLSQYSADNVQSGQQDLTPQDLAYIIYTSGSTGQPKGVMIEHESLSFHIKTCQQRYGIKAEDRVLQFSTVSFDAAQEQIFTALASGASLYIRPEKLWDVASFYQYCQTNDITIADLPPSYCLELFYDEALSHQYFATLKLHTLILGGEALNKEIVRLWRALPSDCRLFNAYGPTEAVITCCIYEFEKESTDENIYIGRANEGRNCYVLTNNKPTPVGVAGELYVGGLGLARGYLNNAELTSQSFVSLPASDDFPIKNTERLYKTGDLVRWLPNGNLVCLGRVDQQVKIRGFRIELAEIAHALVVHPDVSDAIVVVKENSTAGKYLVAYVATEQAEAHIGMHHDTSAEFINSLQKVLNQHLPSYMIPSVFMLLPVLPLTSNGKVDIKALPESEKASNQAQVVVPESEIEQELHAIWQTLLGDQVIGVTDNFFELGGHSLSATRLITLVNQKFELQLALQTVFNRQTIRALSQVVDEQISIKKLSSGELALEDLTDEELDRYLAIQIEE